MQAVPNVLNHKEAQPAWRCSLKHVFEQLGVSGCSSKQTRHATPNTLSSEQQKENKDWSIESQTTRVCL